MIVSTPLPPREGIGFYATSLARELARGGHETTLVTRGALSRATTIEGDGYRAILAPFVPVYPFHVHLHGLLMRGLIRELEPQTDVFHLHSPLVPVPATRKPVVATIHTPMLADTRSLGGTGRVARLARAQTLVSARLERTLLRRADRVTAVARSVAAELGEYGIDPSRVTVVGNGTDAAFFTPADGPSASSPPSFLYAGRVGPRKGLADLLEAARLLSADGIDFRVRLAGSGPLEQELRAQVRRSGLQGRVELLGHIGDRSTLLELYRSATVYVQPSHYEGLPTSLLEAMSCATPCIATRVSGHPDVIEDGRNGWLVPAHDPITLARAMKRALLEPESTLACGLAARRTVEEHLTWPILARTYLGIYREVAGVGGGEAAGDGPGAPLERTIPA